VIKQILSWPVIAQTVHQDSIVWLGHPKLELEIVQMAISAQSEALFQIPQLSYHHHILRQQ